MNDAAFEDSWSRGPFRVELSCELEFAGPLHVGTGEALSLNTDAPVLRRADGTVWLPGSSVRGVLADWCQREAPLLGVGQTHVSRLFGRAPSAERPDDSDWQGRLTVFDVELTAAVDPQVRDHVKINRKWGAAETGAKFDQEVAHPGIGTLHLIYDGDGPDDPELILLRSAAAALREGLLAFGGKTGWGLGAVRVKTADDSDESDGMGWSCVNRSEPGNLSAYLRSRLAGEIGHARDQCVPPSAFGHARARDESEPEAWSWLRLDAVLQFDGPMLIAALDATSPVDKSHFARERREADAAWQVGASGEPILAGSSLRGTLRSDAERIEKTLGFDDLAAVLFGNVNQQGLIRVEEGHVTGPVKPVLLNHVSIDRVTGFAAEGRLFDTAALASPHFRSRLLVRWNHAEERHRQAIALLVFVLRDGEGHGLWIGSRTTRGYGYCKTVEIQAAKWSLVSCVTGDESIPKRQPAECRGTTNVRELGDALGFVTDAWSSALASVGGNEGAP